MKSTAAQDNVVKLGLLRFHGPDATAFLQGQLSNDIEALAVGATQLAGYHNPQGRVIALLHLTRIAPGEILAQLPQELVEPVAQRLRRYVLRSKLAIDVPDAAAATAAVATATQPAGMAATRSRLADIAAGLPQICAVTSERFVAQMLNLDCIGAVSFTKGCYTGQEVVARAHYRGRVKRRMQRFVTTAADASAAPPLVPGASVRLRDGRRLDVVDAAARADGRIEFLAVAPLQAATAETATTVDAAGEAPAAGADAPPLLDCEPLPLPYALPE